MEEVHVVGALQRVWGQVPQWGSGEKFVPQKLKKNVKLVYNF